MLTAMKTVAKIWLAAALLLVSAVAVGGEELCFPEVVWVVRHAEKAMIEGEKDPPLTAQGQGRAEALAVLLGPKQPVAIYSTDYQRTRDTVAPLAKEAQVEVTIVDARDTDGLVETLLEHCGERLVVAGHSNTVPALITGLGVEETVVLDYKTGYGDLFAVRWEDGAAGLERYRFGD